MPSNCIVDFPSVIRLAIGFVSVLVILTGCNSSTPNQNLEAEDAVDVSSVADSKHTTADVKPEPADDGYAVADGQHRTETSDSTAGKDTASQQWLEVLAASLAPLERLVETGSVSNFDLTEDLASSHSVAWSASCGLFLTDSSLTAEWKAPGLSTDCQLTTKLFDGNEFLGSQELTMKVRTPEEIEEIANGSIPILSQECTIERIAGEKVGPFEFQLCISSDTLSYPAATWPSMYARVGLVNVSQSPQPLTICAKSRMRIQLSGSGFPTKNIFCIDFDDTCPDDLSHVGPGKSVTSGFWGAAFVPPGDEMDGQCYAAVKHFSLPPSTTELTLRGAYVDGNGDDLVELTIPISVKWTGM